MKQTKYRQIIIDQPKRRFEKLEYCNIITKSIEDIKKYQNVLTSDLVPGGLDLVICF